jgi:hypothetical protein
VRKTHKIYFWIIFYKILSEIAWGGENCVKIVKSARLLSFLCYQDSPGAMSTKVAKKLKGW